MTAGTTRMPERRFDRGRRNGRAARGIGALASLVLVAMILPGSVQAGPAHPSATVSYAAPFGHTIPDLSPSASASFCHSQAGDPTPARANVSTGNVSVVAKVAAAGCGHQYAQTFVDDGLGFAGPVYRARTTTTVNVTFTWNLSWSLLLRASMANGAAPYSAFVFVDLYQSDLIYQVNGSFAVGGAFAGIFSNTTLNGTLALTHVLNSSVASTTLAVTAGQSYAFQPSVWVFLQGFANPGCRVLGQLDLASGGNGARLLSITVS